MSEEQKAKLRKPKSPAHKIKIFKQLIKLREARRLAKCGMGNECP